MPGHERGRRGVLGVAACSFFCSILHKDSKAFSLIYGSYIDLMYMGFGSAFILAASILISLPTYIHRQDPEFEVCFDNLWYSKLKGFLKKKIDY